MKKVVLLLFLFASAGCEAIGSDYELLDGLPVPSDAYDVKKLRLGQAGNTEQLFFRVHDEYPSTEIVGTYTGYLATNDWMKCDDSNSDWTSFIDKSSKSDEPISVHQFTEYWANYEEQLLLILSIAYYSRKESMATPDNDEQNVVIWVQRSSDVRADISRLSVTCP